MLVNVDGVKYHVSWIHNPSLRFPSVSTGCTIKVDTQVYATGVAMLSKKDNYNYDKGRKISLERALQELFPIPANLEVTKDTPVVEIVKWGDEYVKQKRCRREFWKEYFNMTRKGYLD